MTKDSVVTDECMCLATHASLQVTSPTTPTVYLLIVYTAICSFHKPTAGLQKRTVQLRRQGCRPSSSAFMAFGRLHTNDQL
jgi:hypothetical protein